MSLEQASEMVGLSARQIGCLRGKAAGKNNKEIGVELGVGASTVAAELYAVKCMLGVKNTAAAISVGYRDGWLKG